MIEVSYEILQGVKNRLRISHNSEDDALSFLIQASIDDLTKKCGEFDITTNYQAKELIFERVRYAYNDSIEFFNDNFLSQINSLSISLILEAQEGETI